MFHGRVMVTWVVTPPNLWPCQHTGGQEHQPRLKSGLFGHRHHKSGSNQAFRWNPPPSVCGQTLSKRWWGCCGVRKRQGKQGLWHQEGRSLPGGCQSHFRFWLQTLNMFGRPGRNRISQPLQRKVRTPTEGCNCADNLFEFLDLARAGKVSLVIC